MKAVETMVGVAGAARPAQTGEQGGLAPKTGARIFFVLEKKDGLASLTVTVRNDRWHILKHVRVSERLDKTFSDIVVDMYVNDEYVMSVWEGPETPWFFDEKDLHETISQHGELWTYKQVLGWFKLSLDELEEVVE
jgi:hypothetical protein